MVNKNNREWVITEEYSNVLRELNSLLYGDYAILKISKCMYLFMSDYSFNTETVKKIRSTVEQLTRTGHENEKKNSN